MIRDFVRDLIANILGKFPNEKKVSPFWNCEWRERANGKRVSGDEHTWRMKKCFWVFSFFIFGDFLLCLIREKKKSIGIIYGKKREEKCSKKSWHLKKKSWWCLVFLPECSYSFSFFFFFKKNFLKIFENFVFLEYFFWLENFFVILIRRIWKEIGKKRRIWKNVDKNVEFGDYFWV